MNEELKQHALQKYCKNKEIHTSELKLTLMGLKRSLLIGRNQQRPPKTRQS